MSRLLTSMGEVLIDFLPIQEGGRTTGFSTHAGGAPMNVAIGMSRLGRPTAFAGKVSTDLFGRYLRDYIEGEGVDTRFLLSSEALSTLAFVAMESGEPAYAFYGEGAADTLLTADEVPEALFAETRILHFGSISLLRGTTPAAVLATVERLKASGGAGREGPLLSFDPNVRPGLVRDERTYRDLLGRLFALADIVKLSAADIEWLAPGRTVESYAEELAAGGPALVAITRGSRGVLALRGPERWEIPAFSVPVVDTVGAGDAFSSGLLAGLDERGVTSRSALERLDGSEVAATLRFGSAVSALTCMRPGADPPRRQEVAAFLTDKGSTEYRVPSAE
jgi:fructokinase